MINTITTAPLADYKLPALYIALNDLLMEQVLNADRAFLSALQFVGSLSVEHELLKYAPGKRCVIAYYLRDVQTGQYVKMIGKLYRENRGQHIFDQMRQLWDARRRNRGQALMAQPLHYVPSLGIILQQEVLGLPLTDLVLENTLAPAILSAGNMLAVLHETYVPGLTVREEMAEHLEKYCQPALREMGMASPELRPLLDGVVARLLTAVISPDAPLSTAHSDLNLSHIYWQQGQTFFIDFDGICLSHAALDLANVRVALRVRLGARGAVLGDHFLNAYLETRGVERVEGLAVYEALAYLREAVDSYCHRTGADRLLQTHWLLEQAWGALVGETAVSYAASPF
jgi:hypothetical protein